MKQLNIILITIALALLSYGLMANENYTIKNGIRTALPLDTVLVVKEDCSVKDILDEIITKNKGKVIYVDCWATWCSPCMGEMPNSKALMREFKGKDVAFVFLCLNSQEDIWRSTVDSLKIEGQHYFLTKKQSNDLRFLLKIQGIPYYILYGKDGSISEQPTLRPGQMKNRINKLLDV